MKKRFLCLLIIISLCSLVLAGCGSSTPASEPENVEATVTEEPEATPTPEVVQETTEEEKETVEEEKETVAVPAETVETTEAETQMDTVETDESSTYTFIDMDATKYAKSSVNVRSLPDTSGDKLGGLNTNDEVHVTGQCNETGWFRFEYNGSVAYVSDSYLVDKKSAQEQASNSSASNGTSAKQRGKSTPESDGYAEWTWYDMGAYAFRIVDRNEAYTSTVGGEEEQYAKLVSSRYPGTVPSYGGAQILNDGSGRYVEIEDAYYPGTSSPCVHTIDDYWYSSPFYPWIK